MALTPYAGIGSRRTPPEILQVMRDLAFALAEDHLLRSGGAPGADSAFQSALGPQALAERAEIYLPGRSFNGNYSNMPGRVDASTQPGWAAALQTVDQFHGAPQYLQPYARALMARNAMQVLGPDLQSPSRFVVAWTPNALIDGREAGGTGQALRIARHYGIPIRNLADPDTLQNAVRFIRRHRAQM